MNVKRTILIAVLILAGGGLFLGGFTIVRNWLGLAPPSLAAKDGIVGETGPIGLVFSQPMQTQTVEMAWRIEPLVRGYFRWGGSTLWFFPDQPLTPGIEYHVALAEGVKAADGRASTRDESWVIKVRSPEVAYLAPAGETADLWVAPLSGGAARQLTQGAATYDFAVSSDGEWVAYSVLNEQNGLDLWVVRRDGSERRRMVGCGSGRCEQASWARGGDLLAYSRYEAKNGLPESTQAAHSLNSTPTGNVTGIGQPRIWTVDLASGKTSPLYTDPQVTGTAPVWSPDGRKIAFIDQGSGGVRILNLDSGKDAFLHTNTAVIGSWSADSTRLAYSDLDAAALPSFGAAFVVTFPEGAITPLFAKGTADADYSVPVLSPDGSWYAVGVRFVGGYPSRQLWLLSADGSQQKIISDDVLVTHGAYSWSPDGKQLVFQQVLLGSSSAKPEVVVWDAETNTFKTIAKDAIHPEWMP